MKSLSEKTLAVVLIGLLAIGYTWVISDASNQQLKKANCQSCYANKSEFSSMEKEKSKIDGEGSQQNENPWSAWISAAATVIMALLAWLQLMSYNRAVDQDRRTNERFTNLEETTHANTRKELRAYISVSGIENSPHIQKSTFGTMDDTLYVQIKITNTGGTPAKNIRYYAGIKNFLLHKYPTDEMVREEANRPEMITDIPHGGEEKKFISGAVSELGVRKMGGVNLASLADSFGGDIGGPYSEVRFYGLIEYTDVFGDKWKTQFCHRLVMNNGKGFFWRTNPYNEAT